jgi:hypothetical protein
MPDQSSSSGYGQAAPADSAHPYNITKFIVRQLMNKMVTAKVVQVVAVYKTDGTLVAQGDTGVVGVTGHVDVQPLVGMQDGVGNTMPHGVVHGIPFCRSQGGTNAVIMDPQVGDIGLMVVADRDISAAKTNRAPSAPGSKRSFDIADGMYVLSLLNSAPPTQWVRFTDTGIELIDKNGNKVTMDPAGIMSTPDDGKTSIVVAPGKITLTADEIITHARNKNVWDAGGTGFVYTPSTIDNYTTGVPVTNHSPTPPEVPT